MLPLFVLTTLLATPRPSPLASAHAFLFAASQPAVTASADLRELTRLETVWNNAHQHGDAAALDELWAEDLEVAVPKMPVMKKSSALAFAKTGRMKFEKYETSDVNVRVYENAAVVTGRLQRERSMNGQTMSDDWRFTKVYVRQAGRW